MKVNKKYKGLVTKKFNEFYLVELDKDATSVVNKKFLCKIKKSVNFRNQFVFVGDEVIVYQIDLQSKRATIESLVKRNNLLERPSVANISNIYVICSVEEPKLNLSQVNKFLISSEQLGVEVSLVLTKCDLITEEKRLLLIEKFHQWGYQAITLNLNNPENLRTLLIELKKKKCSIFMGPSGVGKTTLLNMIIPDLDNKTAPVSSKIKRGKNTTRNVELFSLSSKSYIVDTPGFNMQTFEIDILELSILYLVIYNQVVNEGMQCKFLNCLHVNDQGCKLNKNFERYTFYLSLIHI